MFHSFIFFLSFLLLFSGTTDDTEGALLGEGGADDVGLKDSALQLCPLHVYGLSPGTVHRGTPEAHLAPLHNGRRQRGGHTLVELELASLVVTLHDALLPFGKG